MKGFLLLPRGSLLARMSLLVVASVFPAFSQTTRTWDGESSLSSDWSTSFFGVFQGFNWDPNGNPVAGDHLTFAGSNRTTNNNNYAAGTAFGNITFAGGASAFTLGGNSLTLNGSVTNNSANNQTINLPLILPATRTFHAASGNLTIGGVVSGAGGIDKTGAQTLRLTADNSYAGATTVSAGTLLINGDQSAATGGVIVNGGTLGGSGIIGGNVTFHGGTHSPGESPGIQTVNGTLNYNSPGGNTVVWELIGNTESGPGTNFDQIVVRNNLNFNSATTLNLVFDGSLNLPAGSSVDWTDPFWGLYSIREWQVWAVGGSTSGFPANVSLSSPTTWLDKNGLSFNSALGTQLPSQASFYLFQDGQSIYLRYEALPEPGALGFLGLVLGTLTLAVRGRRRLPMEG